MKKNYLFSLVILLVAPFFAQAQVVNGDFENIKDNFLPKNWGMTFLQQIGIDIETGETFGDQIQFTWCVPSMVYASFEPKSGQYAMEISNAYNVTQDKVIPGMAMIFEDSEQDSPGWNPGIPVEPTSSILMLGFDYKFFPAGDDIAQATLHLTDENGEEMGIASVDISGFHGEYEYVYSPIAITHPGTPAFMYISFNMAKEGSTPVFGSRLIVDNVIVNFSTLIVPENQDQKLKVYPTLADNEINVIPNGLSGNVSYKIINSQGKIIKENKVSQDSSYVYTMNISDLSSGIYFLNIQDGTTNSTKKFIKK